MPRLPAPPSKSRRRRQPTGGAAARARLAGQVQSGGAGAAVAAPFSAELELLQRAQTAYTRHEFSGALTLLAEHARRFPRGHLAEERDALRVRCLLGAGRRARRIGPP